MANAFGESIAFPKDVVLSCTLWSPLRGVGCFKASSACVACNKLVPMWVLPKMVPQTIGAPIWIVLCVRVRVCTVCRYPIWISFTLLVHPRCGWYPYSRMRSEGFLFNFGGLSVVQECHPKCNCYKSDQECHHTMTVRPKSLIRRLSFQSLPPMILILGVGIRVRVLPLVLYAYVVLAFSVLLVLVSLLKSNLKMLGWWKEFPSEKFPSWIFP